ncbi:LytTR family transcriptional regulator DNA-binding domain-containing protein [Geomonas nitrogeniifigens]|uniref:LytR/AlgR family response regulator transcription factor n=1 Tax=Geomonas diazotrophica TaxID=2843197 RepID=UPI001C2C37B8|nr:LytTR family DNA-binding domain-containing protein [Geomonas nitrogeniifigens]QXE86366.1 LytTR family transcriptional regulator DNA-binding domain-containing protein [Geomonas nitrogeniifigens]
MSLEQYLGDQGNSIDIGLVLLSQDWQVLGMNEHALRIAEPGMAPVGQNLFQMHPARSREKVRGILDALSGLQGAKPRSMVIDFLGKVLMITLSRLFVPGSQMAWAVSFMDLSEQTGARTNPTSGHLELKKMPIYENGAFHFLSADQVHLIEADGNYCRIHTPQKKFYLLMSLKAVLQRFPTPDFLKVHKSFVVNLRHVKAIGPAGDSRMMVSFSEPAIPAVPVSRRLVPAVKKALCSAGTVHPFD